MNGPPKPAGGALPPPPPPAAKAKAAPAPPAPAGARPLAPPAAAPAASLFELDAPGREPEEAESRTTMEFLVELDEPARSVSREIDLGDYPEVAVTLGQANRTVDPIVAPQQEQAVAEAIASEPSPRVPTERPELLVALPPPDKPRTPEEQRQQRLRRTLQRLVTCRDSFRLIGFLGVGEEDRKTVARMFMELDQAFGRGGGQASPSLVKEPEAVLKRASEEQLDTADRLLGPIEEKLLLLDDIVQPQVFGEQLANPKHTKKAWVRYGRLLVSRRLQAGQRRDRFEAVATHLLSVRRESGETEALPPERAKPVLEYLTSGLQRKVDAAELLESLDTLRDMLVRLDEPMTHDQFFEGLFLDLHGYKISMRDKLLCPEFLYLSVLVNAKMQNRLEEWVESLGRLHDTMRMTAEGTPREQVLRRLREQEEAVEDSLGVKRKPPPQAAKAEPAKPAPVAKRAKPKKARASARFEVDRRVIALALSLVVIVASGTFVSFKTGVVGVPVAEALTADKLAELSPLLVRGWIRGAGPDRYLDAKVQVAAWQQLEPRKRSEEAGRLAGALASHGMKRAQIANLSGEPVLQIEGGVVTYVQGGKL